MLLERLMMDEHDKRLLALLLLLLRASFKLLLRDHMCCLCWAILFLGRRMDVMASGSPIHGSPSSAPRNTPGLSHPGLPGL